MKSKEKRPHVRLAVARMTKALRTFLTSERGPTFAGLEVANNAVGVLDLEPDLDPEKLLAEMLAARLRAGWITGDIASAARVGARAWHRASASFARVAA